MSNREQIWYNDIGHFLTYDNYYVILPLQQMTLEEKINAILRFFIYLGIFLSLIKSDYKYLFFGIIAGFISIILYSYESKVKVENEKFLEKEKIDIVNNKICSRSTTDNPFMNPTIADITENPNHPEACNIENDGIRNIVKQNFDKRMFKDVSDIYDNKASQRQFYTVPVTTIPNDQDSFAKWCYSNGKTCKEGNGEKCYTNTTYMIGGVRS